MLRSKTFIPLVLGFGLLAGIGGAAEVVVKTAPPRAVVEKRGRAPGKGYVWIPGYQNWDGNRYVWTPGRWDKPPRAGEHWQAHHWVHHKDGWVMVEGRWH